MQMLQVTDSVIPNDIKFGFVEILLEILELLRGGLELEGHTPGLKGALLNQPPK
jgi:hypothetical protein